VPVHTLDRSGPPSIRVVINLRSGSSIDFEVDEQTFRDLEALVAEGLDGAELCKAWLGDAMPLELPLAVHVVGQRSDGTSIELSINCDQGTTDPRDHGTPEQHA
jgi:hypothetical protein